METGRVRTVASCRGDVPVTSKVKFEKMRFEDIRGTTNESTIVRFECSEAAQCSDITFRNVKITGAGNDTGIEDQYICKNAVGITGLPGGSKALPSLASRGMQRR